MLSLALPLSEKTKAVGFAVMPRGSVLPVANSILRFFFYWRQRQQRTDYDLSALMLDETSSIQVTCRGPATMMMMGTRHIAVT